MSKFLINNDKKARAEEIVALVSGKKVPQSENESERKEHFAKILSVEGIDIKSVEAVEFVYEKLGGLALTEEENKKHQKRVAEAKGTKKKK